MAGYQTIEAMRPILHRGPVQTPVVDRSRCYRPSRRDCPTYKQIQQMAELRESGLSYAVIGRRLGFSEFTVSRHTKHVVLPEGRRPKGGPRRKFNHERVKQLHGWGFSYGDIAKELGCHPSNVGYLLNGWKAAENRKTRPSVYLEKVVERVTRVSVRDLRAAGERKEHTIAKARIILQWLLRHRYPHLSYAEIGKSVGGFDQSSCSRSYRTVQAVVATLGIKVTGRPQHIVERLWQAEWPKASV